MCLCILGFSLDLLSDIPDDVMINDTSDSGNDLLSSLDTPFNSNINPNSDGMIQHNGPTSLPKTLSRGGTGNVSSDQANVPKTIGMRSPRPNMTAGLSQNCPPQGPISTAGMSTPPTPLINAMRNPSSVGNMQANNPMSSVTSSMINTGTFNSNPMQNQMMPNNNSNVMMSSNSMFDGQMGMAHPMNVIGQNMNMMARGQNFNANPAGFGNNMMMQNHGMYGNMNMSYRMGMNKAGNMGFNPNTMNSIMNPMMDSTPDSMMINNMQNAGGMQMQRMVGFIIRNLNVFFCLCS